MMGSQEILQDASKDVSECCFLFIYFYIVRQLKNKVVIPKKMTDNFWDGAGTCNQLVMFCECVCSGV